MPILIDLRSGNKAEISPSALCAEASDGLVLAIGFFDGVHLGHKKLIDTAKSRADYLREKGLSVLNGVWFFSEPPADVLMKDPPSHICTHEEKLSLMSDLGAEIAVVCEFSELRDMPPYVFVDYIKKECFCRSIVCGFNFSFGKGGEGDASLLKKAFGDDATIVEAVTTADGVPISSSRIRSLVENGEIEEANRLLGHNFKISGEVVHGKAFGRKMGIPTINLNFFSHALVPKTGIYVSMCHFDGKDYPSVTNIGVRPTVDDCGEINCETHLIDFGGDLYGKKIEVSLLCRLRDEKKFGSVEELKRTIQNDTENARDYIRKVRTEEVWIR